MKIIPEADSKRQSLSQPKTKAMFKRIIVAEDFDSVNIAVAKTLTELSIPNFTYVKYCEEAYNKIKRANIDAVPYELLITDLSFKVDHRNDRFGSGEAMIAKLKTEFPELRIIVLSVENRSHKIKSLFTDLKIDAYIEKGRNDMADLEKALALVFGGGTFISPDVSGALKSHSLSEITPYEKRLLQLLADGFSVKDIMAEFQKMNVTPNSESSIEKQIKKLRENFMANNNVQLLVLIKDLGLL